MSPQPPDARCPRWLTPLTSARLCLLPAHVDHVEEFADAAIESDAELSPWSQRVAGVRDRDMYVHDALLCAASTAIGTRVQRHAFTRSVPARFVASVSLRPWHSPISKLPPPARSVRVDESPDLELGLWCRTSSTGQGYAAEATSAVVTHAFEDLHARAIWMRIAEKNTRSRDLAARLAFEEVERVDFAPSVEWGDAATVLFMRRLR